jgi:hypothetical protein
MPDYEPITSNDAVEIMESTSDMLRDLLED